MFLLMEEKPPDGISRGYYISRYQHATATSLPLLKRVHKEDLALFMPTPSSATSLLIIIFANNAGTINIHIGSHCLTDNPSNTKVVSLPYYSSYPHDTKVGILKLSVRSISTGKILLVGATNILPISWLQLLTSFAPGYRSTQMRGLNASAKLAARSITATSNYSMDGSTDLALESHLLLHSLSSHYMIITSTGTTFNKSQNICKQHLPYINVYTNIIIPHRYYFHYKFIQNPC